MSDNLEDVKRYKAFSAALLRAPDDSEMLINQYAHLYNTADRSKAPYFFPLAKRAYLADPKRYTSVFNYGSALISIGEWREAIKIFQWCVENAPDADWLGRAHHHLGIGYRNDGDNAEAIKWYDKAIAATGDPEIKKDRALALLAMGRLNQGLMEFECRRECTEAGLKTKPKKGFGQLPKNVWDKHWEGQDLTRKTIVVYHEEGIGDYFMVCRFIPLLRKFGAEKILLTGPEPHLLDFVSDNIPVDGVVPLTEFDADYIVGSMTLPWRCGVEYGDVNGKPYLTAEPMKYPRRGDLNVGLVWRGNSAYGRNSHRSMNLKDFLPLFDIPGVAYYSLQLGDGVGDITDMGLDGFIADLRPFVTGWRMTARLLANLDVLVSVDTAMAHLAGAMGKPAFVLATNACDWRWDRNSSHTVWYDSVRILRQYKHGDWAPVVAMAKMNLEDMLDERRQAGRSDQQGQAGGFDRASAA